MEKKQRDILIAVVAGVCVLIICVIVGRILLVGGIVGGIHGTLMNMIGIDGGIFGSAEETKITELNQPYEHNGLKITATDIAAMVDSHSDDKKIIAVKLKVENVSNAKGYVSAGIIKTYVDDTAVTQTFTSEFKEKLEYGKLSLGKYTEGYYCVEAPKDTKQFELRYYEEYNNPDVNVTFVFDIPPVEG